MGKVNIWAPGTYSKILASLGMLFKNGLVLISGSANPSAVATSAAKGSLYMSDVGRLYQKQDAGSSTNWLSIDFTKAQTVTVAKSGGQYTAIQDAINAITDATPAKPYLVDVYPGIYTGDVVMKDDVYLRGRVFGDMPCAVIEGQVTGTCASASSTMGMFNLTVRHTPTALKPQAIALVGPGAINLASVSAYFLGTGDFAASVIKLSTITSGAGLNSVTAYDFRTGAVTADSVGLEFDGSGPLLLDGVRSTCSHSRASGTATGFKCSTTGNVSAFGCFNLFSNLAASFSGEAIGFDYPVAQTAGRVRNTTEFFARFINTSGTCTATLFKGSGTGCMAQHVKSSVYAVGFTTNRINSVDAETSHFVPELSANVLFTKEGNGTAIVTPADNVLSGFVEWGSAGATYWSYVPTTLTFTVEKRGSGLVKGVPVVWPSGQSVVLTDFSVNYVYIDSKNVLRVATTTSSGVLYRENILLFEVLVESGRIVCCNEAHPVEFSTAASVWAHRGFKSFLESGAQTLSVTTAASREINLVGTNVILDHGLYQDVAAQTPVSWLRFGRRKSDGKCYQQGSGTAIPTYYDSSVAAVSVNAGAFVVGRSYEIRVPGDTNFTLIGAANNAVGTCFTATGVGAGTGTAWQLTDDAANGNWFVFRLGAIKSNLNTSDAQFVCVMDDGIYGSQTAARNAIAAGTIVAFPPEIIELECSQLGFGIIQGNGTGGSGSSGAVTPVTALQVQGALFASGGTSTAGSLITLDPTSFDGQLSVSESNVQAAFNRLDDYGYIPAWVTSATYRIGNVVRYYSSIYRCTTAHTSSTFDGDIANWEQISIARFATVVAAKAAFGNDADIMYCVETESFYRFLTVGGAYAGDDLLVLTTGAGGDTRWLAVAGQYNLNAYIPPFETTANITAGDQILPSSFAPNVPEVLVVVTGTTAGQNAMNVLPFGNIPPAYLRRLSLVGYDSEYSVTIATNDVSNGVLVAGDFIEIGRGTRVTFEYSFVLERWYEVSRNSGSF